MPLKTIKLIIEYVGTNYCGWQIQPNGTTIQEILEKCLEKITGEKVKVHGSGRTDSGVHAEAQVAHFRVDTRMEPVQFQRALNSLLPGDIGVSEAEEESHDFHAQFSQKGKRYRYTIYASPYVSIFEYPFVWHLPYTLNVDAMKEAATYLVGRHDFAAFQASGSDVRTTVRGLTKLEITQRDGKITYVFEGSGFLKHMVRIVVGTLVDFGFEKKKPGMMKEILESKDRQKAGRTAPSQGLCLEKVYY